MWLLLCLSGLAVGGMFGYINAKTPIVGVLIRNFGELRNPDPASHFGRDQVTLLVLGADADYDNRDRVIKSQARSDTIFVVQCNFQKGEEHIGALSIPRDTVVHIPGYGRQKVNAAHALGGPPLAKETIEELLGIQIDDVLVIDFKGFQRLIDAVGGVWVHVDKKMDYDDNWGNLHIHLKPGYQWMNGYNAMGFVRFRHTDDDFHRIARQQEFANGLREQMRKQSVFSYPDILQKIRNSIGGTLNDDATLISLAAWTRNLKPEQIHMATLPVKSAGKYNLEIDRSRADALVNELNLPGSISASTGPNSHADPRL